MKISKSNFVIISVTMITVLFLFQFSNISALYTSKATINKAAQSPVTVTADQTVQNNDLYSSLSYSTAIVASQGENCYEICSEWCVYAKRTYCIFSDLENLYDNLSSHCQWLFLSGSAVADQTDITLLHKLAKAGIHIIFTSMPSLSIIKASSSLQELLGIQSISSDSFKTNGSTLFEGFFLGGKTTYKKLRFRIPYYKLTSGSKVYMVGTIKDQKEKKIKNEDLPPVMWRTQYENSFIFAVNSDFFKDHTGLGILSAMVSDTDSYSVYPIINAQSVLCENFPYFSNENQDPIRKRYYYSPKALFENVLWPDMVSILDATNDKFTGAIAPKLEYNRSDSQPSKDTLEFYFKQTEKISGELALSGDTAEYESDYNKKLQTDSTFFKETIPNYVFTIFAPGQMPETVYKKYLGNSKKSNLLSQIRTLVQRKETGSIVSFYNSSVLSLANTSNGFSHTDREDFYLKSIETALGYNITSLDFRQVLYSDQKKNDWTRLSEKLSSNLDTYYKVFRQSFSQVTVSQADERARQFLALNYLSHRQSNTINISITDYNGYASFLLNLTNEKIDSVSGGTYKQIENDKYVVNATSAEVTIQVAPSLN